MPGDLVILLIVLLPLASFILLGVGGKFFKPVAGAIGTTSTAVAFLIAAFTAYNYFRQAADMGVSPLMQLLKTAWLPFSPGLSIDMSLLLDPIAAMMIVVVTLVSLMVHIFSTAYMKGEQRYATYFAYLSLFTFSMLGLVLAGNIFQLYIFWELVGVSSYLLISFYYDKPAAVTASRKAFIVTRFADLGFLVGILILAFYGGTLDLPTLIARLSHPTPELTSITAGSFLGISALSWALVLIFAGGAGKSALFPLHVWLPDAMEGPTPVSALIHAATMVVAGVYLVARLFPVFALSAPAVLQLVAYTGAVSAVVAALIACTQTDIKRVLAYSTMSQIGFMMASIGVSGYGGESGLGFSASMFHLYTHAFFKALLFLCAGVIIHSVHSNELRQMGGLRKSMPVTHLAFLVACLAISGIPPFSGFFSKEEILLAAYQSNRLVYFIALFTSALTAFYMFRLYFSIFWRDQLSVQPVKAVVHHEGGAAMTVPLLLLTGLALLAGFTPFSSVVTSDGKPLQTSFHLMFSIPPVLLAIGGIAAAWYLYKNLGDRPARVATALAAIYRPAAKKFYFDELYLFVTREIIFKRIGTPAAWIDRHVVDAAVNGLASLTAGVSAGIKRLQSGRLQSYAVYFFAGIAGLLIYLLLLNR